MKNEDKPINPIPEHFDKYQNENIGLTKREYFAGIAMQGLISSFTEKASYGRWGTEIKETIKCAIDYADELLKQLENSNTKNQDDRN